jgi:hypothetical protein
MPVLRARAHARHATRIHPLVAPGQILRARAHARRATPMILLLAGLVAGCAAPAEPPALQQADAVLERARSAPRVRALAAAELDRAEVALEQARAAARAGAPPDQVEHLAYVVRQRTALAEARATERVARSEVDVLQRALDQVVADQRSEQAGHGRAAFAQRERQRRARQEQARATLAQGEQQVQPKRLPIEGDQQTRATREPDRQARGSVADDTAERASVRDGREARASVADDQEDRAAVPDNQEARAPLAENDDVASGANGGNGRAADPDPDAAGAAMRDITLRLADLSFEVAEPTSETGAQLAALAERLLREPERVLSIEADFDLPEAEARTVMERRVEVVRALLLQRGIAPARLVVRAVGDGLAPQVTSSFVEAP